MKTQSEKEYECSHCHKKFDRMVCKVLYWYINHVYICIQVYVLTLCNVCRYMLFPNIILHILLRIIWNATWKLTAGKSTEGKGKKAKNWWTGYVYFWMKIFRLLTLYLNRYFFSFKNLQDLQHRWTMLRRYILLIIQLLCNVVKLTSLIRF
jgi:hypothetical protein